MQSTRSAALARALGGACRARIPSTAARHYSSASLILGLQQQPSSTQPRRSQQQHSLQPQQSRQLRNRQTRRHASSSSTNEASLRKTPLHDLHLAHGARMVPFGGFHMPVQYASLSVSQSHLHTRERASLFDVGHMVQRVFSSASPSSSPDSDAAAQFLQRVTPAGIAGLGEHKSTLAVLLRADGRGGIVDDTVVTRLGGGRFYVVTNAACREKDDKYFDEEVRKWNKEEGHEGLQVVEERLEGQGLVALQGPEAAGILGGVLEDGAVELKGLLFGQSAYARVKVGGDGKLSSPVLISRGGYTGEDGFEISIPGDETVAVTEALLAAGPEKVQLAGLGARDSLRLEAGMCLYGHDLDESTTPVEAGLSWIIPKERRTADAGFYGADVIAGQLVTKAKGGTGVERRRVGLVVEGAPAREGAEIVSRVEAGKEPVKLGTVTSGCPSPSLAKNIAMGYIKDGYHKAGTEVDVLVRGRPRKAVVTKMPFVPTKYWKGEA